MPQPSPLALNPLECPLFRPSVLDVDVPLELLTLLLMDLEKEFEILSLTESVSLWAKDMEIFA